MLGLITLRLIILNFWIKRLKPKIIGGYKMQEIIMPSLGEDIEEATISFWHVEPGEHVDKGADIVEVSTDKTTFNVPAPFTGVITEIIALEGESVPVGDVLARMEEEN
jgi:2-oxoisovalerate dehydrogenase E2 component (dihydrolipoyl transacylase)